MTNINKRLDRIQEKIKDDKFIKGHGLGNEIKFYIFDYDPKHELVVRDHIQTLKRIFSHEMHGRKIIECDLYKLLLKMAKEKNVFDAIFVKEEREGKDELYKALYEFAKPEIFAERIIKEADDYNVVFITGVGKIYPFIRSHAILNNLQDGLEEKSVIMFYPGEYDGQSLNLFNEFKDDNYYRAFQLVENKARRF